MTKETFLNELRTRLQGLPQKEIDERIAFYDEMINDKMEYDNLTEEQAIEKVGSVDDIVIQVAKETPLISIVKHNVKPKRELTAWEVILLIVGFPLWFPLLISFLAIVFSLYVVLWALVLVVYSVFISGIASAIAGLVLGVIGITSGSPASGFFYIGCAIAGVGLTIVGYYASVYATKGAIAITKKLLLMIKLAFIGKRGKNE